MVFPKNFALVPDVDIAIFYIMSFFGYTIDNIHRTFSHNLFVVILFILLGVFFLGFKNRELGKHNLKISTIFFIISFGILIHLLLDFLIAGYIIPFYPVFMNSFGLNIIDIFPKAWKESILPSIDAVLLVFWLIYMEIKHNISDFI